MKYRFLPGRYLLLVFRPDQFVLPAAIWALFVLITWMLRDRAIVENVIRAYLGFVLPLLGGVLAANAVLDDPALELVMAAPRPAWLTLTERLGLILTLQGILALAYQAAAAALGYDLSVLGQPLVSQLAWFIPCLALIALGSAASFGLAQAVGGALFVGLVWIFEVFLRGWMIASEVGRNLLLFAGVMAPGYPWLPVNQLTLLGLALLLLLAAWRLLTKQERYL